MTQEQWKNRNKKQSSNHIWLEMTDKELWSGAFNALASSMGCKDVDTAVNWADNALKYWKSYDGKVRR